MQNGNGIDFAVFGCGWLLGEFFLWYADFRLPLVFFGTCHVICYLKKKTLENSFLISLLTRHDGSVKRNMTLEFGVFFIKIHLNRTLHWTSTRTHTRLVSFIDESPFESIIHFFLQSGELLLQMGEYILCIIINLATIYFCIE